MNIVGILTKNGNMVASYYFVGSPLVAGENDLVIEKIVYHRPGALYNKGFQTNEPGYSISFVNSNIRHIIPEREVIRIDMDITKEEKSKKSSVADDTPRAFLAEGDEDVEPAIDA
jgi:hypothetical protein